MLNVCTHEDTHTHTQRGVRTEMMGYYSDRVSVICVPGRRLLACRSLRSQRFDFLVRDPAAR